MDDFEYPPGSLGYERQRLDRQLRQIAAEYRRAGLPGKALAWWTNRKRRQFNARLDAIMNDGLTKAMRAIGYDWPPE